METGLNMEQIEQKKENLGYTVVRYAKPASCTSCQLQLGQWKMYRRRMENRFGSDVSFFFVIDSDPAEYGNVKSLLSMYGFSNDAFIDTAGIFINNNPAVAPLGRDVTMLNDSQGKIRFIGNPCKSDKTDSLYQKIIRGD